MQSKPIIDTIRAIGWIAMIGGLLIGGYFILASFGTSGSSSSNAGQGLVFAIGIISIFIGAVLWAVCAGIALIATSVVEGVALLDERLPRPDRKPAVSYSAEPPSVEVRLHCRKCGHENPKTAAVCSNCGTPLLPPLKADQRPPQKVRTDGMRECPQCGSSNAIGLRACVNCGARLVQ